MAADNLPLRDEKTGQKPETFAKVRILPKMYVTIIKPNKKKSKSKNNHHHHHYHQSHSLKNQIQIEITRKTSKPRPNTFHK